MTAQPDTPPAASLLGYQLVRHGNWGRVDLENNLFATYPEAREVCDETTRDARASGDRGWWTVAEVHELEDPT